MKNRAEYKGCASCGLNWKLCRLWWKKKIKEKSRVMKIIVSKYIRLPWSMGTCRFIEYLHKCGGTCGKKFSHDCGFEEYRRMDTLLLSVIWHIRDESATKAWLAQRGIDCRSRAIDRSADGARKTKERKKEKKRKKKATVHFLSPSTRALWKVIAWLDCTNA